MVDRKFLGDGSENQDLVNEYLVADVEVIPVSQCVLLWQTNATRGIISWRSLVERMAIICEIDCIRHWRVAKLPRYFVCNLAVHMEGATRGVLAWFARCHCRSNVSYVAAAIL